MLTFIIEFCVCCLICCGPYGSIEITESLSALVVTRDSVVAIHAHTL